ncbi:MAG: glutamate--tRNA ligase [Candidatus Bathyarchaeia archaeon]
MDQLILKHALINAIQHGGKAEARAVLGKIIAEDPQVKNRIKEVIAQIEDIVRFVNNISLEEQKRRFMEMGVEVPKRKEKEGLPELPNVNRYRQVIMRLAPYPSGPLHIGNARMVILNDEYVKRYHGKLLLVFDDTIGSEEKFIIPEAYDLILEGLRWLGVEWHQVIYKSDRLEEFYMVAEELIRRGLAYLCECDSTKLRANRANGVECEHRGQNVEENLTKWGRMLSGGYREGEATLRLKTDMKHPNPAFRDRVLLRIVDRAHPRVGRKYRVWPMLEFSWAVDDHLLGITHILRGKDLVIEDMVEEFIWDKMGWEKAEFIHYGLMQIKEAKLSKSSARRAIQRGLYTGWDDPRTWSLQSLKKRGFRPEAIRKFIVDLGLSQADITIPAEVLYAENRKIVDIEANRYFSVLEPTLISVDADVKEVEVPLHPEEPGRGMRKIPVDPRKIYVEQADFNKFRNQRVRLLNLFTVTLDVQSKFLTKEVEADVPKIHWVSEPNLKGRIVMPDGAIKTFLGEPSIREVKVDEVIQMPRIGFSRCDKSGDEPLFYFAHK